MLHGVSSGKVLFKRLLQHAFNQRLLGLLKGSFGWYRQWLWRWLWRLWD